MLLRVTLKGITVGKDMGSAALKTALVTLLALAVLPALAQQDMQAELSISHTVQSQNLLPVVGDYVRYDVTIENTGSLPIEGQKLWVRFATAQGEGSDAVFQISYIAPGASAQLHLGPFKMHSAGEHLLTLGANSEGDPGLPNDVALDVSGPADSVTAYSPAVAATLPASMGLIAAGAGFIVWHFARRRQG
jgi:hypothetical protein